MERGFSVPDEGGKTALLVEKNMPDERLAEVFSRANALRALLSERTADIHLGSDHHAS
jgi:hypothetical protein